MPRSRRPKIITIEDRKEKVRKTRHRLVALELEDPVHEEERKSWKKNMSGYDSRLFKYD